MNKEEMAKLFDPIWRYALRVFHCLSQLINVVIFFGTNPTETLSSRCYRLRDKGEQIKPWWLLHTVIDFIAKPFHAEHCKKSYETCLSHAFLLIDEKNSV